MFGLHGCILTELLKVKYDKVASQNKIQHGEIFFYNVSVSKVSLSGTDRFWSELWMKFTFTKKTCRTSQSTSPFNASSANF